MVSSSVIDIKMSVLINYLNYDMMNILNHNWVDTRWQQYITHLVDTRWQQYITHSVDTRWQQCRKCFLEISPFLTPLAAVFGVLVSWNSC
jgi:2-polyprenyl-3-methyl-5-hydroxy-6-metoxy-1,4-benzoquinol methylase